ncbi:hypothetical protein OIU79_016940 [Salix purpurea]|uniref:Uncharacterized protein n=1 Tax=Salix purpurea TaxID=77065 RepID=A0A9Q1AJ79_SALPP|nr:hypothetical protein OIU79_016940 [Salix purpurea]
MSLLPSLLGLPLVFRKLIESAVDPSAVDALLCPCVRSRQHARGHRWTELRGTRLVSELARRGASLLISGLLIHGPMTSIATEFTALEAPSPLLVPAIHS